MRNARTLALKREALTALTGDELVSVAAGQQELTHLGWNPADGCGHGITFDHCPTIPLKNCPIAIAVPLTSGCL